MTKQNEEHSLRNLVMGFALIMLSGAIPLTVAYTNSWPGELQNVSPESQTVPTDSQPLRYIMGIGLISFVGLLAIAFSATAFFRPWFFQGIDHPITLGYIKAAKRDLSRHQRVIEKQMNNRQRRYMFAMNKLKYRVTSAISRLKVNKDLPQKANRLVNAGFKAIEQTYPDVFSDVMEFVCRTSIMTSLAFVHESTVQEIVASLGTDNKDWEKNIYVALKKLVEEEFVNVSDDVDLPNTQVFVRGFTRSQI